MPVTVKIYGKIVGIYFENFPQSANTTTCGSSKMAAVIFHINAGRVFFYDCPALLKRWFIYG